MTMLNSTPKGVVWLSLAAYKWAKEVDGLAGLEKWLLVTLADYYNDEQKRAWPGRAELARRTGMSIRTVTRQISSLETKGLILVERWFNNNTGKSLNNRYYLPKFDPASGSRISRDRTVYAEPERDPATGRTVFIDA